MVDRPILLAFCLQAWELLYMQLVGNSDISSWGYSYFLKVQKSAESAFQSVFSQTYGGTINDQSHDISFPSPGFLHGWVAGWISLKSSVLLNRKWSGGSKI